VERKTRFELATPSLAISPHRCRLLPNLRGRPSLCKLLTIRRSRASPIRWSALAHSDAIIAREVAACKAATRRGRELEPVPSRCGSSGLPAHEKARPNYRLSAGVEIQNEAGFSRKDYRRSMGSSSTVPPVRRTIGTASEQPQMSVGQRPISVSCRSLCLSIVLALSPNELHYIPNHDVDRLPPVYHHIGRLTQSPAHLYFRRMPLRVFEANVADCAL